MGTMLKQLEPEGATLACLACLPGETWERVTGDALAVWLVEVKAIGEMRQVS